jgi:hypothetical protein
MSAKNLDMDRRYFKASGALDWEIGDAVER